MLSNSSWFAGMNDSKHDLSGFLGALEKLQLEPSDVVGGVRQGASEFAKGLSETLAKLEQLKTEDNLTGSDKESIVVTCVKTQPKNFVNDLLRHLMVACNNIERMRSVKFLIAGDPNIPLHVLSVLAHRVQSVHTQREQVTLVQQIAKDLGYDHYVSNKTQWVRRYICAYPLSEEKGVSREHGDSTIFSSELDFCVYNSSFYHDVVDATTRIRYLSYQTEKLAKQLASSEIRPTKKLEVLSWPAEQHHSQYAQNMQVLKADMCHLSSLEALGYSDNLDASADEQEQQASQTQLTPVVVKTMKETRRALYSLAKKDFDKIGTQVRDSSSERLDVHDSKELYHALNHSAFQPFGAFIQLRMKLDADKHFLKMWAWFQSVNSLYSSSQAYSGDVAVWHTNFNHGLFKLYTETFSFNVVDLKRTVAQGLFKAVPRPIKDLKFPGSFFRLCLLNFKKLAGLPSFFMDNKDSLDNNDAVVGATRTVYDSSVKYYLALDKNGSVTKFDKAFAQRYQACSYDQTMPEKKRRPLLDTYYNGLVSLVTSLGKHYVRVSGRITEQDITEHIQCEALTAAALAGAEVLYMDNSGRTESPESSTVTSRSVSPTGARP